MAAINILVASAKSREKFPTAHFLSHWGKKSHFDISERTIIHKVGHLLKRLLLVMPKFASSSATLLATRQQNDDQM